MIWFKLKLNNGNEVSDSKLITAKVTELLGTKELLYTGSHEIIEQEIMVEERFWREYGEWEFDLLAEALEEQEPLEVDGAEVIVIYTVEEKKVLQLSSDDLPVWYIKAQ